MTSVNKENLGYFFNEWSICFPSRGHSNYLVSFHIMIEEGNASPEEMEID